MELNQAERENDRQARGNHRTLLTREIFWRDHQVWLAEKGYMLRPRYRPDWTPSWEDTGRDGDWVWHEDSIMATVSDFTLDMLHVCISYTVASFRYGRNSSIGRRDRYP